MVAIISMLRLMPKRVNFHLGSGPWTWFFGMLSITLVTAIWGYSNVVMRQSEAAIAPSVLLWMRFGVAGVLMIPVVVRIRLPLRHWLLGLGTGVLLGLSVFCQGLAMETVAVDEVAFITALYVVFTPLGVSLLERKWPPFLVWIATALSLLGMALLIGKLTLNVHVGVFFAFIAAIGLTGQIIGTRALTAKMNSVSLAGLQSVGAGFAMTVAVLVQGALHPAIYQGIFHWSRTDWLWIGYLAILATVVAVFLQVWGQMRISATEAALAFNMEPVWTAVFAWLILSQGMTTIQTIGALFIISSLTLVSKPSRRT